MKKNYSHSNKGGKGYNQGYNNGEGGNDFAKGTANKDRKYNNNNGGGQWKQEDNQEKAKLRE